MSQTLVAPATMTPGSKIDYNDGTQGTVAADGTVSVPDNQVVFALAAGFTYQAASASQSSQAMSVAVSGSVLAGSSSTSSATSAGLADSLSRSSATSGGLADSTTRSQSSSTGLSNSIARSAITSGSV